MAAPAEWISSPSLNIWTCFAGLLWVVSGPALAAAGTADYDLFPLLMPKVNPSHEESYICTPIKVSEDETYYIKGFQPNATGHTAHHMLIYGCDEPGSNEEPIWNCGKCRAGRQELTSRGKTAGAGRGPPLVTSISGT